MIVLSSSHFISELKRAPRRGVLSKKDFQKDYCRIQLFSEGEIVTLLMATVSFGSFHGAYYRASCYLFGQ